MCCVSQNVPDTFARALAPVAPRANVQAFLMSSVPIPSRPYSCRPRTCGLFQGSKTVTPMRARNSPTRVRHPNFASFAREATKSIGPDRYTRVPSRSRRRDRARAGIRPLRRT